MATASQTGFFGYICSRRLIVHVLHVFVWLALLLNTVSYFVVTDDATVVIIAFNYVGIIGLLLVTGYLVVKCQRLADPTRA